MQINVNIEILFDFDNFYIADVNLGIIYSYTRCLQNIYLAFILYTTDIYKKQQSYRVLCNQLKFSGDPI